MTSEKKQPESETPEEKKERHLNELKEMSQYPFDGQYQDSFASTEEERDYERNEWLRKQEAKFGKVFKKESEEIPEPELQQAEADTAAKPSKAELVLSLIEENLSQLFTDEYDFPCAAIKVNEHIEVLSIRSTRFRNWISRTVYKEASIVVDSQTIKDVVGVLSAKAEFDGEHKQLNLRVASLDGKWYYDLTNDKWEFIEITENGFKIVNSVVLFRRYGQQPQVYPSREYPPDIFDKFVDLLNIKGDENRLLLKCYIVSMSIPGVPKVILMLHGEQGSAKTTLQELIKMLIDPSIVKTLAFPKNINEFIQQLAHNYVTFYDNISVIRDWVSDLLCRAVTGSGFSKRVLYTDDDDFIYSLKRCVGFNGINLGATKADLLDRGLIIQLERLSKDKWKKIEDIWKEFDEIRPQLLGYILDIVSKVMAWKKHGQRLELSLSRMADWTEYGEIIARSMGYKEKEFLNAYYTNLDLQTEEVLDSSPTAIVLIDFMKSIEQDVHSASPTKWLSFLEIRANLLGINTKGKSWPKGANQLSRRLKELVTTLREIGVEIEWSKDPRTKTRIITIRKTSSLSSPPSPNSDQAQNSQHGIDAGDDGDDGDDTLQNLLGRPPPRPKGFV